MTRKYEECKFKIKNFCDLEDAEIPYLSDSQKRMKKQIEQIHPSVITRDFVNIKVSGFSSHLVTIFMSFQNIEKKETFFVYSRQFF